MKKKLIIGLLPVLMALSACGGANPVENKVEFLEDALAHEELFGEATPAFEKKAVRNDVTPISTEPMVAIQYKEYKLDEVDYMAVRFVAAVKLATPETTVEWNRNLYTGEGTFSSTSTVPSVNRYTTIHDGNTPLTIADFNTAHGTDFNYFVTYTMRKIPVNHVNKYEDYYLNTVLEIGGVSANKVVSTTIDQSKQLSFLSSYTGYFLKGTINSTANVYLPADGEKPDGSKARFLASLKANDSFYIVQNDPEENFFIYDSSCINDDSFFQDDDGKIEAKETNNLALLLNGSDKLVAKEQGYYVTYTDNNDLSVVSSLEDAGWSDTKKQYKASISPKTQSTLAFDYNYLPLVVYAEDGANIDNTLKVTNGGANLDAYLKDNANNSYNLWLTYPTYSIYVNDVLSEAENNVPSGWGDKAVFLVNLPASASITIKYGYETKTTKSTTWEGNYVIGLNSGDECWTNQIAGAYYVKGDFNSWTADENSIMTLSNGGYFERVITTTAENQEFKIFAFDDTWYGEYATPGDNISLGEIGDYLIKFYYNKNDGTHFVVCEKQ